MLTKGDDFPLHQTPEPIAFAGSDRNFYDRYFFNGYSPDGKIFFAAAMGFYPQLAIVDASFCVSIEGTQHNLRASKRCDGDRLNLSVGPIRINVDVPLEQLTLHIAPSEGGLAGELCFVARHFPIEEPRFTRRNGTRLFLDYTRLTQNGGWSGWFSVAGERIDIDRSQGDNQQDENRQGENRQGENRGSAGLAGRWAGTRDRSWGIRPIGAPESQPPLSAGGGQFFWIWTPCNFAHHSLFFHTNDDGEGQPWNRRAVLVDDSEKAGKAGKAGEERHFAVPQFSPVWQRGTRRIIGLHVELGPGCTLDLSIKADSCKAGPFLMSGLGYGHPIWGHGRDHGSKYGRKHDGAVVAYDSFAHADISWDGAPCHSQTLVSATMTDRKGLHHGTGVLEQLCVGPHRPSGLRGLMDPAP